MLKYCESRNKNFPPSYLLVQGDSFQFKAEIKNGLNADLVQKITFTLSKCGKVEVSKEFEIDNENWYLFVGSNDTKSLERGEHLGEFKITYVDGGVSTIERITIEVIEKPKEEAL